MKQHVKTLGKIKNVEKYLLESDIYLHSALIEPFGLVFIEAMAAGLPIVCLNGGGNKDFIINNFNGYILDNPNIELFTDKIIKIRNDQKLYSKLSKNGIQTSKNYGMEAYVDKLITFYNEITNDQ